MTTTALAQEPADPQPAKPQPAAASRTTVILVVGAAGGDEFGQEFAAWGKRWEELAARADVDLHRIGPGRQAGTTDRELLRTALKKQFDRPGDLWLVLIGHGTYDRREAKFNLEGPDVSDKELSEWLADCERSLAIVNCASSSAPFVNRLSRHGRVIVTATRSGAERNYARFGKYFIDALASGKVDLDKDGQTSLLEAFLLASRGTEEFYKREGRLATEHALLDDNGDGRGTPASWFRGIRVTTKAKDNAEPDGRRANQFILIKSAAERRMPDNLRARRDELELLIERLRDQKSQLDESAYYARLETLLLELAELYAGSARPVDGELRPDRPGTAPLRAPLPVPAPNPKSL